MDNLVLLCPNCHLGFDQWGIREVDFIESLAALLEHDDEFRAVKTGTLLGPDNEYRADITCERRVGNGWANVVIECRSQTTFSADQLQHLAQEFYYTAEYSRNGMLVLAAPAVIPADAQSVLQGNGIEVWDLPFIATRFSAAIGAVDNPLFQALLRFARIGSAATREDDLIARLKGCPKGKKGWVTYQKLMRDVMEVLFCPPLSLPIWELSDEAGINRRDIILPNYAEEGFWAFIRARYAADYVVVDAKNHTEEIGKDPVLAIAHYLKEAGAGMFGIIVSREGSDKSGKATVKDFWISSRKLVVILDDSHIIQMLTNKKAGLPPEDVIRQRIEEFRLSL